MEEDKAQRRRDRIFAAVIISLLCTSALVTLTIDGKYVGVQKPKQTTVKIDR